MDLYRVENASSNSASVTFVSSRSDSVSDAKLFGSGVRGKRNKNIERAETTTTSDSDRVRTQITSEGKAHNEIVKRVQHNARFALGIGTRFAFLGDDTKENL